MTASTLTDFDPCGSLSRVEDVSRRVEAADLAYQRLARASLLGGRLDLIDHALYVRLQDQQRLWQGAVVDREEAQIIVQGEAMIRGYQAAAKRLTEFTEPAGATPAAQNGHAGHLEEAGEGGREFLVGEYRGTVVAIGRAPEGRVGDIDGRRVIWLSPDEVAQLWAGLQTMATIQDLWPGARMLRVEKYPDEPAREDGP